MRRLVLMLALCLAVTAGLGAAGPGALDAAASTTQSTTTPSLTGSFPLGHHRLHTQTQTQSQTRTQSQTGTQRQAQPGRGSRRGRPAASVAPGLPIGWILIVLGAIGLTAIATIYVQRRAMTRRAQPTPAPDAAPAAQVTPEVLPEPGSVKFVLYQDNGGGYYWTIVDSSGGVLARSAGFESYPDANFAADIVHRGAATATFEDRSSPTPPAGPPGSADRPTEEDRTEPKRPPDQGGSVSREEVTRRAKAARAWPAGSSSTPGGRRR